jgi:hypothetical protein
MRFAGHLPPDVHVAEIVFFSFTAWTARLVGLALGSLQVMGQRAVIDAFPSRAIRAVPIFRFSRRALSTSSIRLRPSLVTILPLTYVDWLFIRLNVGSEIYHLEAADPSGAVPSSVVSIPFGCTSV